MKNPKLIWKIMNLLYGIPLVIYLFTVLHWPLFYRFKIVHIIIMIAIIYGIKSWIEIKFNMPNLIRQKRITKSINYIGGGILFVGILFKIMHWPFASILLLLGAVLTLCSFILIFFIDDFNNSKQPNPEILDDI